MQAYATVRIGTRCTVFEITFDDTAHAGQLATYLVMAAGQQLDLKQVISVGAAQVAPVQLGELGLAAGFRSLYDKGLVHLLVPLHPIFEMAGLGGGPVTAESPISFMDIGTAEHLRESFESLAGLGEHGDATHWPVQTVRDAHEHLARLGITLSDERLQRIRQALVPGLVPLDDLPHSLVDDENVIVFVQNATFQVSVFFFSECSVFHTAKLHIFPLHTRGMA